MTSHCRCVGNGIGTTGASGQKATQVEGTTATTFVYEPDNQYYKALYELGVFGLWMLQDYAWDLYGAQIWLRAKLLLLLLLVVYHILCGRWLTDFKHDRNRRSHVYFRWMNEVPVLFLVGIVLLAVLKPF